MNGVADFETLGSLWTGFLDGNSRDFAFHCAPSMKGTVFGRFAKALGL